MKRKGMILFYTLVTIAILSMITTTAVAQFQRSNFLSTRLDGETRAYWTARAGLEYAKFKLAQNYSWPIQNSSPSQTFGNFKITETQSGHQYIVHGENKDGQFSIVFNQSLTQNIGTYSSIVPLGDVKDKNGNVIEYFSYNRCHPTSTAYKSLPQSAAEQFTGTVFTSINNLANGEMVRVSSKKSHCIILPATGVYISVEGRTRNAKSVVETIYYLESSMSENNPFQSSIYCAGDMDVNLKGAKSSFVIEQIEGTTPTVMCNGDFTLNRDKSTTIAENGNLYEPVTSGGKAIDLGNGTIFCPGTTKVESKVVDDQAVLTNYGFNLVKSDMRDFFPAVSWEQYTNMTNENPFTSFLPAGCYAFMDEYVQVESDEKDKNGKPKYETKGTGAYKLYYFNQNFANEYEIMSYIRNLHPDDLEMMQVYDFSNLPSEFKDSRTDEDGNTTTELPTPFHELVEGTIGNFQPVRMEGNLILDHNLVNVNNSADTPEVVIKRPTAIVPTTNSKNMQLVAIERNSAHDHYRLSESKQLSLTLEGTQKNTTLSLFKNIQDEPPMLYSDTEIYVRGKIKGVGEVAIADKITFESLGEPGQATNQLSIYAQNDITIKPKTSTETASDVTVTVTNQVGNIGGMTIDGLMREAFSIALKNGNGQGTSLELFNTISQTVFTTHIPQLVQVKTDSFPFYTFEWKTVEVKRPIFEILNGDFGYTAVGARGLISEYIRNNSENCGVNGTEVPIAKLNNPEGSGNWVTLSRAPSYINGIIYTWGNFYADANFSSFLMEGVLVAFGGNPGQEKAGGQNKGNVKIDNCAGFYLKYNPDNAALFPRININPTVRHEQVMFNRII